MTECDEVAVSMAGRFLGCETLDDYRAIVRRLMPGEAEQVINNVAWSAYQRGRQ